MKEQRIIDLIEFLEYAPKIICDFEKSIKRNDSEKIEKLSKIGRILFKQINKYQLANDFDRYASVRHYNLRAAASLVRLSKKQIHKAQQELEELNKDSQKSTQKLTVNLKIIKDLVGPNNQAFNEIIEMYGQQSVEYLSLMHFAYQQSDLNKIRKIAHTMKSSFAMIGCDLLKKYAIQIEHYCEAGNLNKNKLTEFDELVKDSIQLLKKSAKSKILL